MPETMPMPSFEKPKDHEDENDKIAEDPQLSADNSRPLAQTIFTESLQSSELDIESAKKEAGIDLAASRKKSPEIIKEISETKKNILKLMEEIGLEAPEKRLLDNDDIYVSDTLHNRKYFSKKGIITAVCYTNEIEILEDLPKPIKRILIEDGSESEIDKASKECRMQALTQALVNTACRKETYIDKIGRKRTRQGFQGENGEFHNFNEGMKSLTSCQVLLENGHSFENNDYTDHMIFIMQLVKDMAKRLNGSDPLTIMQKEVENNPFVKDKFEARRNATPSEKYDEKDEAKRSRFFFSEREVLAYLQKGMFDSDDSCLELIGAMYGEGAVKALSEMGTTFKDLAETARAIRPISRYNEPGNEIIGRMQGYRIDGKPPIGIKNGKISLDY